MITWESDHLGTPHPSTVVVQDEILRRVSKGFSAILLQSLWDRWWLFLWLLRRFGNETHKRNSLKGRRSICQGSFSMIFSSVYIKDFQSKRFFDVIYSHQPATPTHQPISYIHFNLKLKIIRMEAKYLLKQWIVIQRKTATFKDSDWNTNSQSIFICK